MIHSYEKPLKLLSRGLYEKSQKGFILKPLKLAVYPVMFVPIAAQKNEVFR